MPIYCDWTPFNAQGGACWNCCHNNCEPCCGQPCNFVSGLYCCLCWYFCSCCVRAKLWSSQVDQSCAVGNHCIPMILVSWWDIPYAIMTCLLRFNARKKAGAYSKDDGVVPVICYCLMAWCCCLCITCQQLRTVPRKNWDFLEQLTEGDGFVCCLSDCKIVTE